MRDVNYAIYETSAYKRKNAKFLSLFDLVTFCKLIKKSIVVFVHITPFPGMIMNSFHYWMTRFFKMFCCVSSNR